MVLLLYGLLSHDPPSLSIISLVLRSSQSWPQGPPPPKPTPPAPPRAPRVETPKPIPTPRGMSPVQPLSMPPASRFVPRAPSRVLAALLRHWIDELPADSPGNYINRLCRENDAIPLDCTEIYLWVLRTDGQVLCIDHESFAQRAEPEEDSEVAYGRIEVGARTHPELSELLPPDRRND